MARGGITKEAVEQARNAILSRRESVSIDAIRIELGNTGSKTTIHRYLKELEEAEGKAQVTTSLSEELTFIIEKMSGRLQQEANEVIENERAQHHEALRERDERYEQLRQELLETQSHRDEIMTKLDQRAHESKALQANIDTQKLTIERLTTNEEAMLIRLADKEQLIASLEEKHSQSRSALEHYRNSVKAQREQELGRHDSQVQRLQLEIKELSQQSTARQLENAALQKQCAKLETQLEGTSEQLQKAETSLSAMTAVKLELETDNHASKQQITSVQERYQQATAEIKSLKTELGEQADKNVALISKVHSLKSAANTQKDIMDRWFLELKENGGNK
ncbi:DNA-binding protein [Shewanella avicenniae]|uniref:DNA-binding protein n=1 Tax=Shewanella avicenniae TaxID=2814294 RepID=A0ABX7QKW7_9GAMM|nr:DNA-binding protein [Shewanella avicenniae]QSX32101.1 DNA-binding protein [Shewanella avicenniae]